MEVGGFGAARQQTLVAHVEFVLQDQFEELAMGEPIGGGLLQAHRQTLSQTGQAQGSQGGIKVGGIHSMFC